MRKTLMLFPALAMLMVAGHAAAQSCPAASEITQKPLDGGGYAYQAPGGWSGDNPFADQDDLKSFKFTAVKLKENVVLCDYEADAQGGARMALRESRQPDKGNWNDGFCKSANPVDCTFK